MLEIAKLGYISLETTNVEALWIYYTEVIGFTLIGRDDDGTSYLRHTMDHHTLVLIPSARNRLHHLGFQLGQQQSLQDALSHLRTHGVQVKTLTDSQPGLPEVGQFTDPEGNVLQIYTAMELTSRGLLDRAISPEKLGHIALTVQQMKNMQNFYQQVLGFRLSDQIEDEYVFLRCNPDHHTINLVQAKKRRTARQQLHHIAFQLHDWAHMQRACDLLARKNIPLLWGPGRHGPGHSIFSYHYAPDQTLIELFTDLDLMLNESLGYFEPRPWHADIPQRPKIWKVQPSTANSWGLVPSKFRHS